MPLDLSEGASGALADAGEAEEIQLVDSDHEEKSDDEGEAVREAVRASKRPKANPRGLSSIDESNSGASGSEGEVEAEGGGEATSDDEAGGQGGSAGGSPSSASLAAPEAAESEGEEGALLIGGFSPRPYQKSIIDIVEKPANPRAIQWVYSLCGKYGKSLLAEYMCGKYDALLSSTWMRPRTR